MTAKKRQKGRAVSGPVSRSRSREVGARVPAARRGKGSSVLAPGEQLVAAERLGPPPSGKGHAAGVGLAATELMEDLDALTVQLMPRTAGVRVTRNPAAPAVALFEATGAEWTWSGDCRPFGRGILADARAEDVMIRLKATPVGQDVVLKVMPDGIVEGWTVVYVRDHEGALDVGALLGGGGAQPWLEVAASALARSPRLVDRVAAAGVVARLWSPPRRSRDALARVLAGESPTLRAVAWAGRLTPELRAQAVREVVAEARALVDRLGDVSGALARGEAPGTAALLGWLHRRDDLEGAAKLLARGGGAERARDALEALDREASLHLTAFSRARLSADPRLRDVLWQDPAAWWGGLAAVE